ncbi:nucleoside hydrolase [Nocardia brasiliensis]|uniref:nucleoside hydrolase n=1 Tax=Nocardia brasiliensis TaxID=37326 RepID=UPI001893836D|nr:nucleoside hydrolase [Nocardia brasiliensis]MBF6125515.1 nucleoside hydrolase [Nocardia brasiliensis]
MILADSRAYPLIHFDDLPVIVDTDIGYDADDLVATVLACKTLPLRLLITSDEHDGQRARLARYLLNLTGRGAVNVVAGADLAGAQQRWLCDGLVPERIGPQTGSVIEAVREAGAGHRFVRWIGLGPLTNLATIVREAPELACTLLITQMSGAINYRDPDRAEHNLRMDPDAAITVLRAGLHTMLVLSDTTFTGELAIGREHELYQRLAGSSLGWARLVAAGFDRWFDAKYPESTMHDPLAVAAGAGTPFIGFAERRFTIGDDARMRLDPAGDCVASLSQSADYAGFNRWQHKVLTPGRGSRTRRPQQLLALARWPGR